MHGLALFLNGGSHLQRPPFCRCSTCLERSQNASLPAPSTSLLAVALNARTPRRTEAAEVMSEDSSLLSWRH